VLERQPIESQRDCDTADEGRVVLADQDHGGRSLVVAGPDPAIRLLRIDGCPDQVRA
jgi:hypothetical protein